MQLLHTITPLQSALFPQLMIIQYVETGNFVYLQVYKVLIKLPDGRSYFIFRRYNEFHQMCDKVLVWVSLEPLLYNILFLMVYCLVL